jgi:hypothetical protein
VPGLDSRPHLHASRDGLEFDFVDFGRNVAVERFIRFAFHGLLPPYLYLSPVAALT